ncbi:MAG: tRNA dihydrouridine synthase DusB [Bacteroidales bacterium]|nr:tRNA dihydrouridine synthase DusB [Bacteroidales bacterium]
MVKIGNLEISEFPILLAPMEDVSDPPFRYLCKIFGADITYTEFISSEGLIRDAIKSLKKLEFSESERPIGIQIFGHNVESMVKAAEYAERAKPDIIDINWGCPVKKVIAKGAGAGMLRDIPKMLAITSEVVKSTKLPVTVKTRLGWDENSKNIIEVAEKLQDVGIKAISIHARTKVQGYKGKADWTLIGEVKKNPRMKIPVFGNGDILSPEIAKHFKETYNVDGLMIGRGSYGNPWIFKQIKHYLNTGEILPQPDINERVNICKKHLEKSIEWKGDRRGIFEMRKHYRSYFKGYPNFKQFRMKLVTTESKDELYLVFDEILRMVKLLNG